MKKNKFYYIFILLISFFIFSASSASAYVSIDQVFEEINKKIINPVKQKINSIKNNGLDEIQEQVKDKQEELLDKAEDKAKQTIKEKTKKFIQNRIEWIKNILNPLKIKIQQGSDIIRREVNKLKNYLKGLF